MNQNVVNLFESIVRRSPEKTAIVFGERRISYRQLAEDVEQVANGFASMGIKHGDCVALFVPNSPEFVVCFYALTKLGAVVLPINHLFQEKEVSHYIQDSGVKCVVTDSYRQTLCQSLAEKIDKPFDIVCIDEASNTCVAYSSFFEKEAGQENSNSVDPNATAIFMYSSGSTGRPKCVPRTHAQLRAEVDALGSSMGISADDNILCLVPLYHAHGLGNCLLAATCNGATLVILEPVTENSVPIETPFMFRCARVFELIDIEKISILPAVPYILKAMSAAVLSNEPNISSLKLCFSAGNFLEQSVFDAFFARFKLPVRQLYGCTEAGALSINMDGPERATWDSVGKPLHGIFIHVVDDDMQPLGVDEVGEIVIDSPTLTNGYSNMPELNEEVFKQGVYLTGDLGRFDLDGRLYVTGRKKMLIDTGGRKVDPVEIEDVLMKHPAINEVVVVGSNIENVGEIVKAVIVAKTPNAISEKDVMSYCMEHLTDYKVPKVVEFRESIPKSPLGKVLRKALI